MKWQLLQRTQVALLQDANNIIWSLLIWHVRWSNKRCKPSIMSVRTKLMTIQTKCRHTGNNKHPQLQRLNKIRLFSVFTDFLPVHFNALLQCQKLLETVIFVKVRLWGHTAAVRLDLYIQRSIHLSAAFKMLNKLIDTMGLTVWYCIQLVHLQHFNFQLPKRAKLQLLYDWIRITYIYTQVQKLAVKSTEAVARYKV